MFAVSNSVFSSEAVAESELTRRIVTTVPTSELLALRREGGLDWRGARTFVWIVV